MEGEQARRGAGGDPADAAHALQDAADDPGAELLEAAAEDWDDEESTPNAVAGLVPPPFEVPESLTVAEAANGTRLDRYLAQQLDQVSRSRIQSWIEAGHVLLNGVAARTRSPVYAADRIALAPPAEAHAAAAAPEAMALSIVYEDERLIVIDKPAGLVVHPGAGNWSGTLLNGLLAYDPRLARVPRAGIVHRLDAGTSGLLVVARDVPAQLALVRQLQAHAVVREYWALACGALPAARTVDAALVRDPRHPTRFKVGLGATARAARTHLRCLATWPLEGAGGTVSWVACRLETGRTHQIRVHLEAIGHPLIGDPVYRRRFSAGPAVHGWLSHQALHACRLEVQHPGDGRALSWSCPPPADFADLLRRLGADPRQLRPPYARFIAAAPA